MRVARAALHFWEEPPISGRHGSGTVFFSHCPMKCIYCQNEPIARGNVGKDISQQRLSEIFCELQGQGAENINLVTPTHYVANILPALKQARENGLSLPIVYNTSGYERAEIIELVAPEVDIFLCDARYASKKTAQAYSRAANYVEAFWGALEAMVQSDARIIVRILVLPGHIDEACKNIELLRHRYNNRIEFSIMGQYTPLKTFEQFDNLSRRLRKDEYEQVLDFADSLGIQDYFWQDGDAAQESFIPDFYECAGVEKSHQA
ncbi:MAG: radical SAM protein [Eggerthellaceae bacterium]|nr:radical SAM protein [Eggerthellaceae bacterium]